LGKAKRPPRLLSEFKICHQLGPRVGIRDSGQTRIQRWGRHDAGATLAHPRRHNQRASLAPVGRLGKCTDTAFADGL
jgi:hypothetical protein